MRLSVDHVKREDMTLWEVFGANALKARTIAGFSRQDAFRALYGYKNRNMTANRITEIEKGQKKLDIPMILKICELYGCSMDYLFGLSDEFEKNLAAGYNGLIFQSIRGSVLEMTDQLCINMSHLMKHLPPFQGEVLRSSATNLLKSIEPLTRDLAFQGTYPDVIETYNECKESVRVFEILIAKQMRIMEQGMIDQIRFRDAEESSVKLTDKIEPQSLK